MGCGTSDDIANATASVHRPSHTSVRTRSSVMRIPTSQPHARATPSSPTDAPIIPSSVEGLQDRGKRALSASNGGKSAGRTGASDYLGGSQGA